MAKQTDENDIVDGAYERYIAQSIWRHRVERRCFVFFAEFYSLFLPSVDCMRHWMYDITFRLIDIWFALNFWTILYVIYIPHIHINRVRRTYFAEENRCRR